MHTLPDDIKNVISTLKGYTDFQNNSTGGNGYVVFCKDITLDREVAIKFIFDSESELAEEPRKLFKIDNPNVLKVYDAKIFDSDALYFVTQRAMNGDLDSYIKQGVVRVREAVLYINGILNGLSDLHQPDEIYVHRDLKPSNIFLNAGTPMIGDFGSLKRLKDATSAVGASKQTLFFRSPEGFVKNQHTVQSDLYQVGIILYLLLGGKADFNPLNHLSVTEKKKHDQMSPGYDQIKYADGIVGKKIVAGKFYDLSTLPDYIPKKLVAVIRRALSPNPRNRYESTSEFMRALTALLPEVKDIHCSESTFEVRNCSNKIYKIGTENGRFYVFKKVGDSTKWTKDKSTAAPTFKDVRQALVARIDTLK